MVRAAFPGYREAVVRVEPTHAWKTNRGGHPWDGRNGGTTPCVATWQEPVDLALPHDTELRGHGSYLGYLIDQHLFRRTILRRLEDGDAVQMIADWKFCPSLLGTISVRW